MRATTYPMILGGKGITLTADDTARVLLVPYAMTPNKWRASAMLADGTSVDLGSGTFRQGIAAARSFFGIRAYHGTNR